jgi:DegV family protein with EDD domain
MNLLLTRENTALVLDSTADFPEAPQRFANMRVVPLYVRFDEESFRDYEELGPDAFYDRLRGAATLPATSQPTPQDFLSVYEQLGDYERILSIHIASNLSGTFASAGLAAEELGDGRVRLIDSRTASAAIAMLALAIERRLEHGTTDEEVEALAERYARDAGLLFTVDTLEFLARGGRIGRARALAGQLLNVKPILTITNGEVVPLSRVRGWGKAMAEFAGRFEAGTSADSDGLRVGIAHAQAPERVAALEKMVRHVRPRAEIEHVTTLGAVVGTHAGPGTIGFFWFDDT